MTTAKKVRPGTKSKVAAKSVSNKVAAKSAATIAAKRSAAKRKSAAKKPAATRSTTRPAAKKPSRNRSATQPAGKAGTKAAARASSPGLVATLAGISTSAVAKATGHGWSYWLKMLDKAGAAQLPHKEIAQLLYDKLGLRKNWWVQMVAVGYEQARGLRKPNQSALGFAASVSRTIAVPISALFAAWEDGRRGDWLPDAFEVRRATKNKSMRITWPDGSGVDVNFYEKGGNKAVVAIEQSKLPDEGAVHAVKQLWGSTLDRLKATLEGK